MKHEAPEVGRQRGFEGGGVDRAGGGGMAPGKRTATQGQRASDPVASILRGLDHAQAGLANARARHLPAMRAAIDARDLSAARTAGAALTAALTRIDAELDAARRWAMVQENAGVLALLAPLEAQRETIRGEAAPVLALAPPAAPAPPVLSEEFDPANPFGVDADHDAAEGANHARWAAQLDAAEAAGGQVIDARDRFGGEPVQRRATGACAADDVHAHAQAGVAGAGGALPHLAAIQASFGAHDVTGIRAHVGGAAAEAAGAIGAEAYATGDDVAFASSPSLFVAAHEAAHVVQQRAGVSLLGGVGEAGDAYEQQADAVAEQVVRGERAEGLLGVPVASLGARAIQRHDRKDQDASPFETARRAIEGATPLLQAALSRVRSAPTDENLAELRGLIAIVELQLTLARHTAQVADDRAFIRDTEELVRLFELHAKQAEDGITHLEAPDRVDPPVEHDASEAPALEVSPAAPHVVADLGTRMSTIVMLWNRGDEPIALHAIEIPDNPAFAIEATHGSNVIPAGGSVSAVISFCPTALGATSAVVTVVTQDGTGFSFTVEGTGTAPAPTPDVCDGHDDGWWCEEGVAPEPALPSPARPAPVPDVAHAISVETPSTFTTMAGRRTMPQPMKVSNPNDELVLVQIAVVGQGDAPPFTIPSSTFELPGLDSAGKAGELSIPVTFAPGAAGDHDAELVLSYRQREARVPLRGAAIPAPTTSADGQATAIDPDPRAPTALPEAHAATPEAARAMLLQAADSLSALAPSYQLQVPPMREVAARFVEECADAASAFNVELIRWLTEEASFQLGSLTGDHARAFLEFAVSQLTIPSAPAGVVLDAALMGLAMLDTSKTNEKLQRAQAQTGFLGEMLAAQSGDVTRAAVIGLATELDAFGTAAGNLEFAAKGSMGDLKLMHELMTDLSVAPKTAEAAYSVARDKVASFNTGLDELGRAMDAIAATRNQLVTDLPTTLAKLRDRYLEFIVMGGKPEQKSARAVRVVGWVSSVGGPPTAPEVHTYADQVWFGSLGNDPPRTVTSLGLSDLSSTMGQHARSKRPAELPGWAITYELTLTTRLGSSEMEFRREANGSLDQDVSGSAEEELDPCGGIAEVWRRLLARPLA